MTFPKRDINQCGCAVGASSGKQKQYYVNWNHYSDSPHPDVGRGVPDLATQPELGLFPERRLGFDHNHPDHTNLAWEDLIMIPSQCQPARCVIAMAASVGGLNALSVILGALPGSLEAAITIVMHVSPNHKSLLAEILKCRTPLNVRQAEPGDLLCNSSVFVAPPNHHLFVTKAGVLELSSNTAEKIHYARPSAEPLFASVAEVYGKKAIGVVLTGGDGDGSTGVQIIKDKGGMVIAQDRSTSQDFSMPASAIETGDVDFILPLNEIASMLIELIGKAER